jgi:hypothetical protein
MHTIRESKNAAKWIDDTMHTQLNQRTQLNG